MNGNATPSQGMFVAIVGASGSGKDTLLRFAEKHFRDEPRVHFVRRAITRPAHPTEDHEPVSPEEFASRLANNTFALHWGAHGLSYGLPNSELQGLDLGHVVIANVSRAMQAEIVSRFDRHLFIEIAANEKIRAARIGERRRASDGEVKNRLDRNVDFLLGERAIVIENDGAVDAAGMDLVNALRACLELVLNR